MNKQRNPDIDFGFHASIPRAIRTGYKNLTPVQKWLYVCLKDLAGEHGTCYRTVPVLSEESGISTGMISESIPVLQESGLIHAEKKKRSSGGKPIWHITIVDIWQSNGKLHPTKRSHSEQERSLCEQTSENVHTVNDNIHTVNDDSQERSHSEQERSHSETEEVSLRSIITEEISDEEERDSSSANIDADASALPPSVSSSLSSEQKTETQSLQQIIENKTANGVGSPPAPSKEANNGQEAIEANLTAKRIRTRKQKREIDEQTQRRIEDVYSYLDRLKREVMGDDTTIYQRTVRGNEAILALLPLKPTDKRIRKVFFDMWNEKDANGQYFWRKRMKPHNICNEYESRLMGLEGKSPPPINDDKAANVGNINSDNPYQLLKARAAARRAQQQQEEEIEVSGTP